jgi:DNA-binding MarR family transcriptional regulator
MDYFRAEGLLRLTLVAQKIARCLAGDAGLTLNEFHCMMQLRLEKPCCVRKLTEILGIGPTSTSKILRSLDQKGWLTRGLDPKDRRMERVALTVQGMEMIEQIMTRADAVALEMIAQLPLDRREPFTECIHTVTRHITSSLNNK